MTTRPPVRVWFIMVNHPEHGWMRVGKRYLKQDVAKSWVPFVKKAWRGLPTRFRSFTARYKPDGTLTDRCKRQLDEVFNCDP